MRIPNKKELLELQRKYKTDRKIGEVYGVPARLVAYWRSKKKIGSYSQPKYTNEQILEYWERFGDDGRAGAELDISAAGFRQWRRKYKIIKKPAQLRLEQLELNLGNNNRRKSSRKETIIQKVLAKKAGLKRVEVGQFIDVEPDLAVSDNNSDSVIEFFEETGAKKIWDTAKVVIVLDCRVPAVFAEISRAHSRIREFAKKKKIKYFYDVGEGICNQVILENAHILPGNLAFGSHHQATSYGCLGAVSAKINPVEMAALWATGKIWMKVPSTVKVVINGKVGRGVYAKDIILKLMRDLLNQKVNYKSLEFYGSAVSSMSISERLTLTGFAELTGAKSAIVPFDDVAMRYIKKITKTRYSPIRSDHDSNYENVIEIGVNYLTPQVSLAGDAGRAVPVEDAAGKKIDLVVLGSCANGRIDDMEVAAGILQGRRINRDLRMIVIPGSRKIMIEAIDKGIIRTFVESGCVIVNPGCGSCPSSYQGSFIPGEKILTTTCGEHDGKPGSVDSGIYMASPATAAATALKGSIADPRKYMR
ncbi:MAG: 3-isopropylmalate dehydratase large subunit [Candidatus Zixiibacteriota bacterium]|nr:MAG: 3-isopropylmalate dehydratase large subunit [candidate division Zixibacteria bacterium]